MLFVQVCLNIILASFDPRRIIGHVPYDPFQIVTLLMPLHRRGWKLRAARCHFMNQISSICDEIFQVGFRENIARMCTPVNETALHTCLLL